MESRLLKTDEEVWDAMNRAGTSLGRALLSAYLMTGFPQNGLHLLGLIGKGHNGGDALLAFLEMAETVGCVEGITLVLSGPRRDFKPHTGRALELLEKKTELEILEMPSEAAIAALACGTFDIVLDGLLGMQFRPPFRDGARSLLEAVNGSSSFRLRAAVDLPSGNGDESDECVFKADFTFATGILKKPLFSCTAAGNIRYLDIGFFQGESLARELVVTDSILDPLRSLRSSTSEKRQQGHLAVLGGSRSMPGALAMSVKAALKSGVGLVTVFAPESIVSQLACQLPEAMWRTWPETPEGGLALEGLWQVKSIAEKATCLLAGPGMGSEAETQFLLSEVGRLWDRPVVLDADALRPVVVEAFRESGNKDVILTPHAGEFIRLSGDADCSDRAVLEYAKQRGVTVVRKGSNTRVSDGEQLAINPTGNAVLSRGGSGDILAGLTGGLFAQGESSAFETASRSVYWHGKAADLLAKHCGQTAVCTTDLLGFLVQALRS
ncbi:NAD(P)H-hydrate dehydratase [Pelagicoccus sp. SDUM812002]|nr:NAD(P)H-hydrate dehydratase [Pelagicoccus sp. SDUM812002]